jgi:mannose-6-phosphate isomerase-like protein (cupin superfamily)
MPPAIDIAKSFIHLCEGGGAELVNVTPSFWRAPDVRAGLVLGAFDFTSPRDLHSSMQEMHPEADEVLMLVSGSLDVILEEDDARRTIALETGQAAIVPRGVWHHLEMRRPGRLVFINCRAGMQSRSRAVRRGAKR